MTKEAKMTIQYNFDVNPLIFKFSDVFSVDMATEILSRILSFVNLFFVSNLIGLI